MCDLVAPLLVTFDDEALTYACFCHLMERMIENFPNGNAMDCHFANMRSLIQILDAEMYEQMHAHGDYTHFYFCYRWFLLDFKRELVRPASPSPSPSPAGFMIVSQIYPDVFTTWEVIWAAQHVASGHFVLFLALALLETYRDIILSNGMDFTDIIKFFNGTPFHFFNLIVLIFRFHVFRNGRAPRRACHLETGQTVGSTTAAADREQVA